MKTCSPIFSTGIGVHSTRGYTTEINYNRGDAITLKRNICVTCTQGRPQSTKEELRPNGFSKTQAPLQPKRTKTSHLSTAFPNSPTPKHMGRQRSPEFHPKTLYPTQISSKPPESEMIPEGLDPVAQHEGKTKRREHLLSWWCSPPAKCVRVGGWGEARPRGERMRPPPSTDGSGLGSMKWRKKIERV